MQLFNRENELFPFDVNDTNYQGTTAPEIPLEEIYSNVSMIILYVLHSFLFKIELQKKIINMEILHE